MRVATIVLGVSLLVGGGVSEASETFSSQSLGGATVLADGMMAAPVSPLIANDRALSPSMVQYARDSGFRSNGVRTSLGAMGFASTQNPGAFVRAPAFLDPFAPGVNERFDPGRIPLPAVRTVEDHLLTGFVAVMLIAYQLRRKHRFLRPHQFST